MNQTLTEIFNDTVNGSKAFEGTFNSSKKSTFTSIIIPDPTGAIEEFKSNIQVIESDSVSALVRNQGERTCVLNMASPNRPGGGVKNGARAQEECLFRCSNLVSLISEAHYPLEADEAIYTIDSTFFKDVNYEPMESIETDVVTVAAFNVSKGPKSMPRNYTEITLKKIRLMLSLAIKNDVKTIILGAWGCGVFKNDPQTIARLFHRVLVNEGFQKKFKKVIFAVVNDRNSVGNNLLIFNRELNGK